MAITSMSAPETVENYERATRIAETLGDSLEAFMALWGDWLTKSGRSRILEAARRSDDLVELAQRLVGIHARGCRNGPHAMRQSWSCP